MRLIVGHHRGFLTALAILMVAGTGCSFQGLNFRADDRIEITFPEDESVVTAPVEVTWTVEDFDVTGPTTDASPGAGYFGVLLDRFPQPPGEPISWFVRGDQPCLQSPRCPSLK
ncbi:MAG: hypothetical protein LC808_39860, partial [Actinobacteria bacterium]|nr:hypothetical protein [Actinomycetota bacterium]